MGELGERRENKMETTCNYQVAINDSEARWLGHPSTNEARCKPTSP
jgi:hypothetical protein